MSIRDRCVRKGGWGGDKPSQRAILELLTHYLERPSHFLQRGSVKREFDVARGTGDEGAI